MGEIFSRPTPKASLPFTGERLTSELAGQTEIEHLHRYMLARHLCRGRTVLDIASGEGYGAALLAQVAASVVGVEVAAEAVAHATANYANERLRFLQGDAREIPLGDASVDIAVSFETIEHFDGQDRFLSEVRRVLRPGGMLIVSTPDRDNYSPAEHAANPFHALELTREEFLALLRRHFGHVATWWQRAMVGSALLPGPDATVAQETICFERRGPSHFEASRGYARPQYLVAVCSDIPPPPLPASLYVETGLLNAREDHLRALLGAERDRSRAAEQARQQAEQVRQAAEAGAAAARDEAEGRQAAAERLCAELRAEVATRERLIAELHASSSWRLTRPLRALRGLLQGGSP